MVQGTNIARIKYRPIHQSHLADAQSAVSRGLSRAASKVAIIGLFQAPSSYFSQLEPLLFSPELAPRVCALWNVRPTAPVRGGAGRYPFKPPEMHEMGFGVRSGLRRLCLEGNLNRNR